MGKAALILVLGTSLFLAYGAASRNETSIHTAQAQAGYEERVLAREIARTGFNVTMGILREHGDDLQAGVQAINGELGYLEGESQGGVYRTHARYRTGHSVEVISTGYFGGAFENDEYQGGATYDIEDNFLYEVSRAPLHVAQCSQLNMVFLASQAGWCSAVYLERHLPGAEAPEAPEMIYAPGKNRNDENNIFERILAAGTQMNFFLAVSQNCNAPYGPRSWGGSQWRSYQTENHVYNRSDYNHIHYALDIEAGNLGEMEESIWAMVEQHPQNNQRWRIAWEDQHNWNLAPNHGQFHNPERSLGGLKVHGYDGNGWPSTDAWGYRTLRDFGDRPDFSDQVVELWMEPADCSSGEAAGGGEDDEDPEEGGGSEGPSETPSNPPPTYSSPETPINQVREDQQFGDGVLCPCSRNSNNRKILIWHQQGGSRGNALCISENGWLGSSNGNSNGGNNGQGNSGHKSHERDFIMCNGN